MKIKTVVYAVAAGIVVITAVMAGLAFMHDRITCTTDSDCAPEQCCHPTSVINSQFKWVCSQACTTNCVPNTLDCGQARPVCTQGQCKVEWRSA